MSGAPNDMLVPTCKGEAPLYAAHRGRSASDNTQGAVSPGFNVLRGSN
jgi:hypothetical protein